MSATESSDITRLVSMFALRRSEYLSEVFMRLLPHVGIVGLEQQKTPLFRIPLGAIASLGEERVPARMSVTAELSSAGRITGRVSATVVSPLGNVQHLRPVRSTGYPDVERTVVLLRHRLEVARREASERAARASAEAPLTALAAPLSGLQQAARNQDSRNSVLATPRGYCMRLHGLSAEEIHILLRRLAWHRSVSS